jgi:hypothetical protein
MFLALTSLLAVGATLDKELLKKEVASVKTSHHHSPAHPHSLYVFVSFSMPEAVWLSLSEEAVKAGGVLVLRGLPDNNRVGGSHKTPVLSHHRTYGSVYGGS